MKLFGKTFGKGQKEEIEEIEKDSLTDEQKMNIDVVIARHQRRIMSLDNGLSKMTEEILEIEESLILTKSVKVDKSNKMVNKMAIMKHEIEIREGLIKWLTY